MQYDNRFYVEPLEWYKQALGLIVIDLMFVIPMILEGMTERKIEITLWNILDIHSQVWITIAWAIPLCIGVTLLYIGSIFALGYVLLYLFLAIAKLVKGIIHVVRRV